MENVLSTLINDVVEALRPVIGLREVGENWGQLSFEQPPVGFPCALVDIASVRYSSNAMRSQTAEGVVTVTVAAIMHAGIAGGMPSSLRQSELSIHDIIQNVNAKLHGKGGVTYSPLMRESLQKVPQDDQIRQFVLSYRFAFTDSTSMPQVGSLPLQPALDINVGH